MPTLVAPPRKEPYTISAALDFPKRLFNPPPAPPGPRAYKLLSPDFTVNLEEILGNRQRSPLSLKDFEEYLLFKEFSAENLYFVMWLREYTAMYSKFELNQGVTSGELAVMFSRAQATFFDATSNKFTLNLPEALVTPVIVASRESSHPNPTVFNEVNAEVINMLQASLVPFTKISCGNVDLYRSWFCACLGTIIMCCGLGPVLGTVFTGHSRWIRITSFALFSFGAAVILAALSNSLCWVIYLFGDVRQLRPYELLAPTSPISSTAPKIPEAVIIPSFPNRDAPSEYDEETKYGSESDHKSDAMSFLTASFIPKPSMDSPTIDHDYSTTAASPSLKFGFDFEELPPRAMSVTSDGKRTLPKSSPVFGAITKVTNPIVRRYQWEVAIKSLQVGGVIGLVITIICVAVPNHRL